MSETYESPVIPPLNDPIREPPDGGSTPDPVTVGVQSYPPPKDGDGNQQQ